MSYAFRPSIVVAVVRPTLSSLLLSSSPASVTTTTTTTTRRLQQSTTINNNRIQSTRRRRILCNNNFNYKPYYYYQTTSSSLLSLSSSSAVLSNDDNSSLSSLSSTSLSSLSSKLEEQQQSKAEEEEASSSSKVTINNNTDSTITTTTTNPSPQPVVVEPPPPLLLVEEGLMAINKPLNWTSNNVVSYLRGILERDARQRGAKPGKVGSKKNKGTQGVIRVGHGGTLDPLASGVLVIGIGRGTKQLSSYLSGTKRYRARGRFGIETTTLDMEGNITKEASFDHITQDQLQQVFEQFRGTILQIPPIYSAIKKDGQRLYEQARKGTITSDDITLDAARQVEIYSLELINYELPEFEIDIECGGGTYIRSLIRDIGYSLNTVATTTVLQRTKQGPFLIDDTIPQSNWSAEAIYTAIQLCHTKQQQQQQENEQDEQQRHNEQEQQQK